MIKGVVQKIIKNEQYGLTSFVLKGQDGMYSLGKDKPTFIEGDSIQFETKQVGKYTYAKDIAPWSDGGTATGVPVDRVAEAASSRTDGSSNQWKGRGGFQRRGSGGAGADKDEYWKRKEERDIAKEGEYALTQKRIEIQAARNAAIETATAMWELDIGPKPKATKDHYDAFMALIDELTTKFMDNTATRLADGAATESPAQSAQEEVQTSGDTQGRDGTWD